MFQRRRETAKRFERPISIRERILSIGLLALLPVVATAVYLKGQRYDPALFSLDLKEVPDPRTPARPRLANTLPPDVEPEVISPDVISPQVISDDERVRLPRQVQGLDWQIDGDVETFTADNLYEKIDGRAEHYLRQGVECLEFISYVDPERVRFIDVFLYDMGASKNASKVFALEKPHSAFPVSLGVEGYRVEASYFFWRDRHYVQVIAGDAGPLMEEAAFKLALAVESALRNEP